MVRIKALAITDDVVEFMAMQLQKLPSPIPPHSPHSLHSPYPHNPHNPYILSYRFLHDRVQQAAYGAIDPTQQQHTHLQIGRLLLANLPIDRQSEKLFEIVNHFNVAIALLQAPEEREMLARLNLAAAQKARASIAYTAAASYARIGTQLVGTVGWKQQYRLTLILHEVLAEAAFLSGDLETVPALVRVVLDRVTTTVDRVKSYDTLIQFHLSQKQYQQAISCGLEILRQLGIKLSPQPHRFIVLRELVKIKIALWGKSDRQLLDLPATVNVKQTAQLQILALLITPAFFVSEELMVVLTTTGIQQTLRHGNTRWAATFYGTYAIVLSSLDELQQSYQIGELAIWTIDRVRHQHQTIILDRATTDGCCY